MKKKLILLLLSTLPLCGYAQFIQGRKSENAPAKKEKMTIEYKGDNLLLIGIALQPKQLSYTAMYGYVKNGGYTVN